ncbi:N-acetyltransferase [Undibacterium cyanobacteriorum]|uniref:N-acetyltransferase n=1 Tax=Undibacterium cyanobacteriorum TaxID=3073561 RepID=A0ABY9RLL1_9BURK|nr:N-acetyltransferase [Undibacterium sp. 20NA77.5]WMW81570.1 N-acetyltransferase [Undibacterium sp. 20NA77.5]
MHDFLCRPAQASDLDGIRNLYQQVAKIEGGLARVEVEITEDYIHHNLQQGIARGICIVAEAAQGIVGEIHCYPPTPRVFSHVLSDLTIAVHPNYQGKGVGRAIFTNLLETVIQHRPEILRVELIARESNQKAIRFYQSLGFTIEGEMKNRIRRPDGAFESDIPMAWLRSGQ